MRCELIIPNARQGGDFRTSKAQRAREEAHETTIGKLGAKDGQKHPTQVNARMNVSARVLQITLSSRVCVCATVVVRMRLRIGSEA